jgi:hypothetical protein
MSGGCETVFSAKGIFLYFWIPSVRRGPIGFEQKLFFRSGGIIIESIATLTGLGTSYPA